MRPGQMTTMRSAYGDFLFMCKINNRLMWLFPDAHTLMNQGSLKNDLLFFYKCIIIYGPF